MEVDVVKETVVAKYTSEKCDCGARGSEEAIAVGCFQDAKERSPGDLDLSAWMIDASDAATFVDDVRSVSWQSRALLLLFS